MGILRGLHEHEAKSGRTNAGYRPLGRGLHSRMSYKYTTHRAKVSKMLLEMLGRFKAQPIDAPHDKDPIGVLVCKSLKVSPERFALLKACRNRAILDCHRRRGWLWWTWHCGRLRYRRGSWAYCECVRDSLQVLGHFLDHATLLLTEALARPVEGNAGKLLPLFCVCAGRFTATRLCCNLLQLRKLRGDFDKIQQ